MTTLFSNRRTRLFASLWSILLCVSIGLTIFFFATSPASAYFNVFAPTPFPTTENHWAIANLPKPTYTPLPPTPTSLPTEVPTQEQVVPTATEAPAGMTMEIVGGSPSSDTMAPIGGAPSSNGSKYIFVDISQQHMYVYEGNALIYSFVVSTGINNGTRAGNFAVQSKIPNAYGSTWNIWMPYWLGIYWSGGLENGIHALPILPNGATLWEGFLGRPISYGCVVLGTYDAQVLYDWAEMGTPVEIQW